MLLLLLFCILQIRNLITGRDFRSIWLDTCLASPGSSGYLVDECFVCKHTTRENTSGASSFRFLDSVNFSCVGENCGIKELPLLWLDSQVLLVFSLWCCTFSN